MASESGQRGIRLRGLERIDWRRLSRRLFVRLTAGMLLVALPVVIVTAYLLSSNAAQALTTATESSVSSQAALIAGRLNSWIADRQGDLATVADQLAGQPLNQSILSPLTTVTQQMTQNNFDNVEIVDLNGRIIASTGPSTVNPVGQSWWQGAQTGAVVIPPYIIGGGNPGAVWPVSQPLLGSSGTIDGAVIGSLNFTPLAQLVEATGTQAAEVHVVEASGAVVYSSSWGTVTSGAQLTAVGGLHVFDRTDVVHRAVVSPSQAGSYRGPDYLGAAAITGYAYAGGPHWVVVANEPQAVALAAVSSAIRLAVLVVVVCAILIVLVSVAFARSITNPIRRLQLAASAIGSGHLGERVEPSGPEEIELLGGAFNEMVERIQQLVQQLSGSAISLASASQQMVATTTEQSSAATETSASMEELARTSSAIADTMETVSAQTRATRDNLEQARHDIEESSERTSSLAAEVERIGGVLKIISEIANQTNLLALNAAIEAARAGDQGRGFAVVADEVRRLAERSKASTVEIAQIIGSAQRETEGTILAMDKGSSQLEHGLEMLEQVTDASVQVQLTTQQQRAASQQVAEAMEQITLGSRDIANSAQQVSETAAAQAQLVRRIGWEQSPPDGH